MDNTPVSINVGGKVFLTTGSTLRSLPNTLLAELIEPENSTEEATEVTVNDSRFQNGGSAARLDKNNSKKKKSYTKPEDNNDSDSCHEETELYNRARYIYLTNSSSPIFTMYLPPPFSTPMDITPNVTITATKIKSSSSYPTVPAKTIGKTQPSGSNNDSSNRNYLYDHNTHLHHQHHHYYQQQQQQQHPELPDSFINLPPTQTADLYIDRNPVLMPYILDAYRLGQLHLPANICSQTVRAELKFWKISEDMISECCWKNFQEGLNTMEVVDSIAASLYDPYDNPQERKKLSRLGKLWLTLERPSYNAAAKVWCAIYYAAIVLSNISFMLLTIDGMTELKPEFESRAAEYSKSNTTIPLYHYFAMFGSISAIEIIEYVLRVFFTVELLIRLLTCPDKLAFLRRKHNILDITIVVLVWLKWIVDFAITRHSEEHSDVRSYVLYVLTCLQCTQCLRVLHLMKHMYQLKVMYLSIRASMRELLLLVVVMITAVLIFGTSMFLAETVSSETYTGSFTFQNIPIAMWWALITMTTVGYGDYYPTTTPGYVVGVCCAVTGLLLVAMPIAIVASNFSNYYDNITSRDQGIRRQQFMETIDHPLAVPQDGSDEIKTAEYQAKSSDVTDEKNGGRSGSDDSSGSTKGVYDLSIIAADNRKPKFVKYEPKTKQEPLTSGRVNRAFSSSEDDTRTGNNNIDYGIPSDQPQPRSHPAKYTSAKPIPKNVSQITLPSVNVHLKNDASLKDEDSKDDDENSDNDGNDADITGEQTASSNEQSGVTVIKVKSGKHKPTNQKGNLQLV